MSKNNNRDKKRRQRYVLPFDQLSDEEREKELKIGKRGYQYCAHTLRPLSNIDEVVYNKKLDLMFENRRAETDYYKDLKWKHGNKAKRKIA